MLKILSVPNKSLTKTAEPVLKIDKRVRNLVKDMEKTLQLQDDPPGVGLAASQVGENIQLFIIKTSLRTPIKAFLNPKILEQTQNPALHSNRSKAARKKGKKSSLEGCLSVPRIWSPIHRPSKVLLEYETLEGKRKKEWFSGFAAVVVQHEMDHLQGILFTQRAVEQNVPIYEEKGDELKRVEYF